MSQITSLLEKSKQEKELLSFYIYGDDEKFWCGYVIDYSEEFVAIQHFTKLGEKDGIVIHPINQFERIDYKDTYIKSMEYIIENKALIQQVKDANFKFSNKESYFLSLLNQLVGNKDIMGSFQISNNDYYTGYVIDISDIDFIVNCVGSAGEELGMSILKIEDITNIRIDDGDNRKRDILFKRKKASL